MKKLFFIGLFAIIPFCASAHGGLDDHEFIIRMTENGFEPKTLTVTAGDEVLFINNDDTDHWPASNFHPTHTLYPEFDSKDGIAPGESWKIKFEKVGVWRMHDHLFPHLTGTITVLEDPDSETTTSEAPSMQVPPGFWQKLRTFFEKLFHREVRNAFGVNEEKLSEFKVLNEQAKYVWLEKRADSEGPETAWRYVLAAYKTPAGSNLPLDPAKGNAHDMAHLVGQLIFKKEGLRGLSVCTPDFAFGCYHGLLEVAFSQADGQSGAEKIRSAEAACRSVSAAGGALASCIHGIGHGLITYREHDFTQALTDCDIVKDTVRTYCHDGIFMELAKSAEPNFYHPEDPLYPCNTLALPYQGPCARSQASVMKNRMKLDTPRIAELCRESGSETIHHNCIAALGFDAAHLNLNDAGVSITECERIENGADQADCKSSAAGELVFQNAASWKKGSAAICESLSGNYKKVCDATVESIKRDYNRF